MEGLLHALQYSLKEAMPLPLMFSTRDVVLPGRRAGRDSFPTLGEWTKYRPTSLKETGYHGWPGQFGAMRRQVRIFFRIRGNLTIGA